VSDGACPGEAAGAEDAAGAVAALALAAGAAVVGDVVLGVAAFDVALDAGVVLDTLDGLTAGAVTVGVVTDGRVSTGVAMVAVAGAWVLDVVAADVGLVSTPLKGEVGALRFGTVCAGTAGTTAARLNPRLESTKGTRLIQAGTPVDRGGSRISGPPAC
jgi:hypothetical protein